MYAPCPWAEEPSFECSKSDPDLLVVCSVVGEVSLS